MAVAGGGEGSGGAGAGWGSVGGMRAGVGSTAAGSMVACEGGAGEGSADWTGLLASPRLTGGGIMPGSTRVPPSARVARSMDAVAVTTMTTASTPFYRRFLSSSMPV